MLSFCMSLLHLFGGKKAMGSIKSEACQNKATNCGKLHTRAEVFCIGSSCSPCFLTVCIFRPDFVIRQPSHLAVNRKFLFQRPVFVCFVAIAYFETCMCTVVCWVINITHIWLFPAPNQHCGCCFSDSPWLDSVWLANKYDDVCMIPHS